VSFYSTGRTVEQRRSIVRTIYSQAERERDERRARAWVARLAEADRLRLVALEPDEFAVRREPVRFQGYAVVDEVVLDETADIRTVGEAVLRAIEGAEDPFRCWNPHHGVQASWGEDVADVLICYECNNVYVYAADLSEGVLLATSEGSRATLDRFLERRPTK
jgi:hypothetical protein